jgi:hypothetical protein
MPRRKQLLDNSKQPIKDVLWYLDCGVMVAHCPSCEELAYEENECVFCHQKYRYTPKPKGYEDTVITIGEWEICQVYGSWGVYITHNGKLIIHASCSQKLSEEKLKEWLENYANK